jgi:polyhydroxyalkanoate synthesis repressor PhaR
MAKGDTVSQTVEITRYPNRRLYDRNTKRYVTLGEIEDMVRSGKNVLVRDSKSQEDLTRVILAQILLERHPERLRMFPVPLLHEFLRADQMALDWLTVYLGQAKAFMETLPGAATFAPGMDYWQRWMTGAALRSDDESPKENPPSEPDGEMAERLADLERRLKELEARRR